MNKVKYFGIYSGPGFGGFFEVDRLPGFTTLGEARLYFHSFQLGEAWGNDYMMNEDNEYVPWAYQARTLTPSTTDEDSMGLYPAVRTDHGTWIKSDYPTHRIIKGERGGSVIEKF